MELVLSCAIMKFQKQFFKQILGIVMGTNLAPILANIYIHIYGYAGRRTSDNMYK